jgi:peptide/nickel transport system permease protein
MSETTELPTPPAYGEALDAAVSAGASRPRRNPRSSWAGAALLALGAVLTQIRE